MQSTQMMFIIIILMIVMMIMAMRERGNKLGPATFITHHSREREREFEGERVDPVNVMYTK